MTPIEIHFDRGHGEKTLSLTSQRIGEGGPDDLLAVWQPDLVVFAANGADYAAPPFDKGAPVLRSIRSATGQACREWRMLLPLPQTADAFLRFLPVLDKQEPGAVANWGIWVCESEDAARFPHLMLVNLPLWSLRAGLGQPEGAARLSAVYRAVLGAVDLFRACRLIPLRTIALADLGGNMLKPAGGGPQTTRIGVFGEVIGAWLAVAASTDRVVIAFDGDLAGAWQEHAGQSRNDEAEFGEARDLRQQNAGLCRRVAERVDASSALGAALAARLKENADLFAGGTPSLLVDLTQSRTLAEAIVVYLLEVNAPGRKVPFEFEKKIEFLGEQCGVSTWIRSYLHTLRILGNEGAHTRNASKRRPEQPVGRDLVVIHAALSRVLTFALDECGGGTG